MPKLKINSENMATINEGIKVNKENAVTYFMLV